MAQRRAGGAGLVMAPPSPGRGGEAIIFTFGPAIMNQEVAAILISELAQALPQRFDQPAILCKRLDAEKTDLVDCARVLRACGAWHGHRCARNRRNELPPPHEHLPRERTLLLSRVKHDRTRYAIG